MWFLYKSTWAFLLLKQFTHLLKEYSLLTFSENTVYSPSQSIKFTHLLKEYSLLTFSKKTVYSPSQSIKFTHLLGEYSLLTFSEHKVYSPSRRIKMSSISSRPGNRKLVIISSFASSCSSKPLFVFRIYLFFTTRLSL